MSKVLNILPDKELFRKFTFETIPSQQIYRASDSTLKTVTDDSEEVCWISVDMKKNDLCASVRQRPVALLKHDIGGTCSRRAGGFNI